MRADAAVFALSDDLNGTEFGVRLPMYLRRAYRGPFLEPGFIARTFAEGDHIGPQALLGWHWSRDSGLNVAVAIGAAHYWLTEDEYEREIVPSGDFRVGYAF